MTFEEIELMPAYSCVVITLRTYCRKGLWRRRLSDSKFICKFVLIGPGFNPLTGECNAACLKLVYMEKAFTILPFLSRVVQGLEILQDWEIWSLPLNAFREMRTIDNTHRLNSIPLKTEIKV